MSQLITPPDLELWACRYLTGRLSDVPGLTVSNRVPDDYDGTAPLITVRDDGGSTSGRIVFVRAMGVTVRGWSRDRLQPCRDLAARTLALLTLMPDITEDSPIAALDDDQTNGPYRIIDDQPTASYYLTVGYRAVGTVTNIQQSSKE